MAQEEVSVLTEEEEAVVLLVASVREVELLEDEVGKGDDL